MYVPFHPRPLRAVCKLPPLVEPRAPQQFQLSLHLSEHLLPLCPSPPDLVPPAGALIAQRMRAAVHEQLQFTCRCVMIRGGVHSAAGWDRTYFPQSHTFPAEQPRRCCSCAHSWAPCNKTHVEPSIPTALPTPYPQDHPCIPTHVHTPNRSAGIAHNKILAKLSSSLHKPNIQALVLPRGVRDMMQV